LPAAGSVLDQDNLTMEIFAAMRNYYEKIQFGKLKK